MRTKEVFDVLTDFVIFGQFVFYLLATDVLVSHSVRFGQAQPTATPSPIEAA